jgi:hypothetical protein
MAALTQANYSYVVQKDLSEVFATEYGEFQSMIPALFTTEEPNQAIVYELLLGDLSSVHVFDGEVYYDESKQSYRKSTEEVERALGVKVTKKFRRNDLYGVVRQTVATLADRFRASKESLAAGIFNGAFSTTTVADGQVLCYSAHTSDVGGSNQGNAGSSVFSAPNVEATRRLMIKFKSNRDNITTHFPDMLIVPTELEESAMELIKSTGKIDTANNNINFHQGKYKLVVWHNWLSSGTTAATADWFMVNSGLMKKYLKFYEWNPVEFFYAGDIDSLTSKHVGYMSNNVSTPAWNWIYGHNIA